MLTYAGNASEWPPHVLHAVGFCIVHAFTTPRHKNRAVATNSGKLRAVSEAGSATPVRQLTDCGFCGPFAVGFRACGAWAKTQKGRRSGERDLRYSLPSPEGRESVAQGVTCPDAFYREPWGKVPHPAFRPPSPPLGERAGVRARRPANPSREAGPWAIFWRPCRGFSQAASSRGSMG